MIDEQIKNENKTNTIGKIKKLKGYNIMKTVQQKIINYYIAKQSWLQKKTGHNKKFITKHLLNKIHKWPYDDCTYVIKKILKTKTKSFNSNTCPHCILNIDCSYCEYEKKYGECSYFIENEQHIKNPWSFYVTKLKNNSKTIVPKYVIDNLTKD